VRQYNPEEIENIIKMFNEDGEPKGYAEGGEVEAEMKPTPQNPLLGKLAGGVRSVQELASRYSIPEIIPLVGGMGVDELLGLPGAARETERWSYGNYPMRVNPYAGRTSSFVPEVKPGRQSDLGDTLLLGSDLTGVGSLAGKYGLKAGKAGLRTAGEELNRAVMEGEGLLSPLISQAAQPAYVVKNKGGNWSSGTIDRMVEQMKLDATGRPLEQASLYGYRAQVDTRTEAMNKWVDTKLKKYIQNEMGTPEDPVRALADEGVLHYDPNTNATRNLDYLYDVREAAGMPTESTAKTDLGAAWEELVDTTIGAPEKGKYGLEFGGDTGGVSDLGFYHLADEMKNAMRPDSDLPDRLRIDPAKLEKMTVPQVVERVSQINAWRAENMAEANAARAMNPATQVVKEYPDQGYKWVELKTPSSLPEKFTVTEQNGRFNVVDATTGDPLLLGKGQTLTNFNTPEEAVSSYYKQNPSALEDALKYEGETMGHCVGGYCPDVMSGETRIYSLRDSKGQPHVTIEVAPVRIQDFTANTPDPANPARTLRDRINAERKGDGDFESYGLDLLQRLEIGPPMKIVQIKGKQNRAPKDTYLPFVQDFVKGRQWSEVGDLGNTGLIDVNKLRSGYSLGVSNADFQRLIDAGLRERGEALEGLRYGTVDDIIKTLRPEAGFYRGGAVSGHAAGGLVSAYNPEAIDAMVNQILEGEYV
jgi:hypothetical protein